MAEDEKHTLHEGMRQALKTFYEETIRQIVEILNSELKAKNKQLETKDEQLKDFSQKLDHSERGRERVEKRLDEKNQQINYLFNEMRKLALDSGKKVERKEESHRETPAEVEDGEMLLAPSKKQYRTRSEEEEDRHIAEARKIAQEAEELTAEMLQERLNISHAQAHRVLEFLKSPEE